MQHHAFNVLVFAGLLEMQLVGLVRISFVRHACTPDCCCHCTRLWYLLPGHLSCVKLLLDEGANIEQRNVVGLHLAYHMANSSSC